MLILGLGLHLRNRLDLTLSPTKRQVGLFLSFNLLYKTKTKSKNLEDEETLVVEIDAALLEGVSDLGEVAGLVVHIVLALATLGHVAHHNILQGHKNKKRK